MKHNYIEDTAIRQIKGFILLKEKLLQAFESFDIKISVVETFQGKHFKR